jgi:hypothetical protein
MPKQNKGGVKRARNQVMPVTPKPNGHSLIVRSAESLGRVIGALQRQLEDVAVAARAAARKDARPVKKRPPLSKTVGSRTTTAKGRPRNTGGKVASNAKGGRGEP